MMTSVLPLRSVSSLMGKGTSKSMRVPGENVDAKSNDAGKTPTIVVGSALRVMERPTTSESAA